MAIVLGYHGCDEDTAQKLLSGSPFVASSKPYDWLGNGFYFWEGDIVRALFPEGKLLYEDAGFLEKTHVQIAVRAPERIRGVFRIPDNELQELSLPTLYHF